MRLKISIHSNHYMTDVFCEAPCSLIPHFHVHRHATLMPLKGNRRCGASRRVRALSIPLMALSPEGLLRRAGSKLSE